MNKINFEKKLIELTTNIINQSNSSHLGSCMSIKNILTVFFNKFYNKHSYYPLVLSKGHAAAIYYSALHLVKEIRKDEILKYCQNGSIFPGHLTKNTSFKSLKFSSGSLGHGLPYSTGLAYSSLKKNENIKYTVLISDGELNEGTTWESFLICKKLGLKNLTIIIDHNRFQSYGSTKEVLDPYPIMKKICSFGLNYIEINGHNNDEIITAFKKKNSATKIILANTIKGIGLGKLENTLDSHYLNN